MLLTQSLLCGLFGPFYHAVSLKSTLHSVFNSVSALLKMDTYICIATLHIVPIIHSICYMSGAYVTCLVHVYALLRAVTYNEGLH